MGTPARLQELIEPIVTGLGLELFDLQFAGSTLSVVIDRPRPAGPPVPVAERQGVDMEAVTAVTRAVSRALDEADPIAGRYSLEVSSPGLERPLRLPRHFVDALGEVVTVKTVPGHDGPRRLRGVLVSAAAHDDGTGSIEVRVDDDGAEEVQTVPYAAIERARTVFEWGPDPRPGGGKGGPSRRGGPPGSKGSTTTTTPTKRSRSGGGPAADGDAAPRAPGGDQREQDHRPGARAAGSGTPGSATPPEPDAMINGDDQKVSAT